MWTNYVIFIP